MDGPTCPTCQSPVDRSGQHCRRCEALVPLVAPPPPGVEPSLCTLLLQGLDPWTPHPGAGPGRRHVDRHSAGLVYATVVATLFVVLTLLGALSGLQPERSTEERRSDQKWVQQRAVALDQSALALAYLDAAVATKEHLLAAHETRPPHDEELRLLPGPDPTRFQVHHRSGVACLTLSGEVQVAGTVVPGPC